MKLLVDVGNTRLKWASIGADGQLRPGGVFAHADGSLVAELRREWGGLARVQSAWVASVVASVREQELAAFVRERFGLGVQFVRSPAAALGVRNAYAEPERLGVDRFLALAAEYQDGSPPARAYRIVLAGHPVPKKETAKDTR